MNKTKRSIILLFIIFIFLLISCQNKSISINDLTHTNNSKTKTKTKKPKTIIPSVYLSPTEIFPGDYFVIFLDQIYSDDKINFTTNFNTNKIIFYPFKFGKIALVGVNYRTEPGQYICRISVLRNIKQLLIKEQVLTISPKNFTTQYLKVTPNQKAKRNPKLWQKDAREIARAKSVSSATPLWKGNFIIPVEGRISTEFGVIRYINNQESGRHGGIDIAAPEKTPIKATNRGIVTLAMNLNVTGNTIIIDHGLNLYSSYAHLDTLYVKPGQLVKKGDIIGKLGSTGFSTGPHLHWTMTVGNVFINPWIFLEKDPLSLLKKTKR